MPVYKRGCVRVGTFRNSTHVQMGYVTNTRMVCLMLRQHGPATFTGAASLFFTRLYIFAAALMLAFIGCFLVIPACLMCACTAHSN
jgi:hypothetical protein